jgi:hypothetical protein
MRLFIGRGVQLGQNGFSSGLGVEGDLGGDFGGTHSDAGFFGLHLAIGRRLGVTGGNARRGLGGTAGGRGGLMCKRVLFQGPGLAGFVGGDAPVYFFFPLGRKVGLAECAQSSKNPFKCSSVVLRAAF